MKITIESTNKIVDLQRDGHRGGEIAARIWEGTTDDGVPVHCYIVRIACDKSADQEQFQRDLQETRPPSAAVAAIPLRLIL